MIREDQPHAPALWSFGRRQGQFVSVALTARHAIPAIYEGRGFVASGGLISYGARFAVINRQLGIYAGKGIKGTMPAELPVQRPTLFELVINLKTAKVLGLTIAQSILARVDEVIE